MTRLVPLLCMLALPAMAADYDTVTVLDSATNVTEGLTGQKAYKTILIENGGGAAIYCSRDPSVTVNNGHYVPPSNGSRSFPYDGPWYCIAAASQTGTNRDQAIVTGSNQ